MPATNLIVSFKLASKDKYFSRKKYDILYKHKVSLADVIACAPVRMTALDGRVLNFPVDNVMAPGEVMKVEGHGFPKFTNLKGDLYIRFDIQFPEQLSKEQKSEILAVLAH